MTFYPVNHHPFQFTTNEIVILVSILSVIAVIISAILIWRQLAYMSKQDKTNKLLTGLSTRVSAALISHVPGGTLGFLNVGQIDLYIHGVSVDDTIIFYDKPLYSPPAGDQSYKLLVLGPTINQAALSPGSYKIKVFVKDSLKRKWVVEGVADKVENSRGFSMPGTVSVTRKNWQQDKNHNN